MSGLPRLLCAGLLAAGALSWLLGPGAPAEPRGAEVPTGAVGEAHEVWPAAAFVEGELADAEEAEEAAAEPPEPEPGSHSTPTSEAESESEPAEAGSERPEIESESPPESEASAAPRSSPSSDCAVALVRRMLALHARMMEE
jgi:hypothetical protein